MHELADGFHRFVQRKTTAPGQLADRGPPVDQAGGGPLPGIDERLRRAGADHRGHHRGVTSYQASRSVMCSMYCRTESTSMARNISAQCVRCGTNQMPVTEHSPANGVVSARSASSAIDWSSRCSSAGGTRARPARTAPTAPSGGFPGQSDPIRQAPGAVTGPAGCPDLARRVIRRRPAARHSGRQSAGLSADFHGCGCATAAESGQLADDLICCYLPAMLSQNMPSPVRPERVPPAPPSAPLQALRTASDMRRHMARSARIR